MALIDKLTAIGDAIRAKTGQSGTLTLPQMAQAINDLSAGFENEVTFGAVNYTAQAYLTDSANYVANDFTASVAWDYASTTTRHDLPNAQTITLPTGASVLYVCDSVTGRTVKAVASGASYALKNLIPNRTYFVLILDASGDLLKACRFKATGALRMIDANYGSDGLGTFNIRDIGGWSCDGGTIAYGKIFRGSQLNSIYTARTLNAGEKAVFKDFLGIRDDIDLRNATETAGQDRTPGTADDFTSSALGEDVDYLHVAVSPYTTGVKLSDATQTDYYKTLIKRVVFDVVNGKPCYIHCSEGADRTGTLICLIEALCGVSQTDLDRDYELTSLAQNRLRQRTGDNWKGLMNYINGLQGTSFRDKVLYYALQAGVTIDEVNALRQHLIDGTPETIINPFTAVYSITAATSTHTHISNNATTITEGDSYTATITADTDYAANVTVTMGGTDITSTAYSNGTISIVSVTGNLVITVTESYTGNLFDASAATLNARIRSNGETTSASSGQLVTDFIPVTSTDILHIISDKAQNTNTYTGMISLRDSSKAQLAQYGTSNSKWTWGTDYKEGRYNIAGLNLSNVAYVRLCVAYTDITKIVIQLNT